MLRIHRAGWVVGFLFLMLSGSASAQFPDETQNSSPSRLVSTPWANRLRSLPGRIAKATHETFGRLTGRGDTFEIPLTSAETASPRGASLPDQDIPLVPLSPTKLPRRTLDMGMPAPRLKAAKWLQGEPIGRFDGQHVYVLAFWTSDDVSRDSLVHLNELQKNFADRGVIVIAQHCWEELSGPAQPFLGELDAPLSFRVALDDRRGSMYRTWVEATGNGGVPRAFVIDRQQRIAWFGHPKSLTAPIITSVVAGMFDIEQAKRDRDAKQQFQQVAQKYALAMDRLMKAEEWDKAEQLALRFEQEVPESFRFSARHVRFKIAAGKKNGPAVNHLARQLGEDPAVKGRLNDLVAWEMALMTDVEGLDLKLAEQFSRRELIEAEGADRAQVLDTLARILFRLGRQYEAIAVQREAIVLAAEADRAAMIDVLNAYEKGVLPDVKP